MRVRDIMSSPALTVAPSESVKAIARRMEAHGVSALPVVEDGRVVGLVSKTDIVRREQAFEGCEPRRFLHRPHLPAAHVRTAREAMTSPALVVEPSLSAVGAAWLMTEHDAHHLPVVEGDRLVGMVTRSDLVRAFARSDEQVRAEIVREVLPAIDVSENDVEVSVANGTVTLRGDVEDESVARCLPHAVRSVIGVVEVDCELHARRRRRTIDTISPRF